MYISVKYGSPLRNVLCVVMILHHLIGEIQDNLSWDESLEESFFYANTCLDYGWAV